MNYDDEVCEALRGDHRHMVKFSSPTDDRFIKVKGKLEYMARHATSAHNQGMLHYLEEISLFPS